MSVRRDFYLLLGVVFASVNKQFGALGAGNPWGCRAGRWGLCPHGPSLVERTRTSKPLPVVRIWWGQKRQHGRLGVKEALLGGGGAYAEQGQQ